MKKALKFIILFILCSIVVLAQAENSIPSETQSDEAVVRDTNASYIALGIYRYEIYTDIINGNGLSKLGAGLYNIDYIPNLVYYFYGVGAGYNFDYDMPELDTYIGFSYYLTIRLRAHLAHDMNKFNFSYTPEIGLGLDKGFAMLGYRMWAVNPNEIRNEIQFHLSFRIPFGWYY